VNSDLLPKEFRMRIDREGNWFCNDQPITNEKVYLYFIQHIVKNGTGKYEVKIKNEACALEVEDTPFVVKHAKIGMESDPRVIVFLNDRTTEVLSWEQVWLQGDSQVYCQVKNGEFEARFNRNSQFAFARLLQFDEQRKRYYFEQGGTSHYLSERGTGVKSETNLQSPDGRT